MSAPTENRRGPLLPVPDVWSAPFWEQAAAGRLVLQRCSKCSTFRYPCGPRCPSCGDAQFYWREVSGAATILSWVVFHQVYYPEYDFEVPYTVVLVRLIEGPKMISSIDSTTVPELGMNVKVRFRSLSASVALPYFTADSR
jgi:uncharacterized OB-fold protein